MKNKNKKTEAKQKIIPEHPYFNEIKGYYDVRSADKINVSLWRVFGLFGLTIGALGVSGMIYIGAQTKFIPMVFYTDVNGAMQYGGVVSEHLKITQPMIANQLSDYLIALRQIPLDINLKEQYMRKVKMMTTGRVFSNIVIPSITERYTSAKNKTLMINIRNIMPISSNVWEIDWDEVCDGVATEKYKGTITFTLNASITDPAILLYDPLGIVITDININQEISH